MNRKTLAGVGLALTTAAMLATGPAYAATPQGSSLSASEEQSSHAAAAAHARDADKDAAKAAKKAGAVLDTGTRGYGGGLLGAVPDSYPLYSSTYTVSGWSNSPEVLATCGSGFFVDYTATTSVTNVTYYDLNVDVNSSSVLLGAAIAGDGTDSSGAPLYYPKPWNQVATDSGGNPQYQGFWMKLNNSSVMTNTGSFSWTCNPVL